MNLVIDINTFNSNYVYFQEPIKNNIISDSDFIRIIYSNELFMLNGICFKINLKISNQNTYFNKYKYTFDYDTNKEEILKISLIEQIILHLLNIKNKKPVFRIGEQLSNENIKLFTDDASNKTDKQLILKISGVWETEMEYGMIYKFINA